MKKLFLLALVNDVTEDYDNVKLLFQSLSLLNINFSFAVDLKLANILCGIKPHSCMHPCCYCDAPTPFLTSGQLRTLGKMKSLVEAYNQAGCVKRKAQKVKNCINFLFLCGDDDAEVLDVVPPHELHLLLGTTNKIFDELNSAWGEVKAYKWAYKQGIARAEYRGGSMEGNQCQMGLKKAATLYQKLPEHLKKFGLALDQFSQVVEDCFSQVLCKDCKESISKFQAGLS